MQCCGSTTLERCFSVPATGAVSTPAHQTRRTRRKNYFLRHSCEKIGPEWVQIYTTILNHTQLTIYVRKKTNHLPSLNSDQSQVQIMPHRRLQHILLSTLPRQLHIIYSKVSENRTPNTTELSNFPSNAHQRRMKGENHPCGPSFHLLARDIRMWSVFRTKRNNAWLHK